MPQCSGCSKPYKFLEEDRCETCCDSASEPKPRTHWPLCSYCGKRFEFIDCTKPCAVCQEREQNDSIAMPPPSQLSVQQRARSSVPTSGNEDIHYAMTHPVNPRTHSARDGPTYRNPLQSYGNHRACGENDPRALQAQQVMKDYHSGYADALSRVNPGTRVARPKLRGIEEKTSKPVIKINIIIRKLHNRNKKTISTPFHPQVTSYEDTTLWSDVEKNILHWLDGVYSGAHNHRVRTLDDFTLYYNHGHCVVHDISKNPGAMIRDVWRKATEQPGLLVPVKSQKSFSLELDAHVEYPAKDKDSDLEVNQHQSRFSSLSSFSTPSGKSGDLAKRKRAESYVSCKPFKRSNNSSAYITDLMAINSTSPAHDAYVVYKTMVLLDKFNSITWSTSDTSYEVFLEKKDFSSGAMKRAYKLHFKNEPSTIYAAKRFYEIGNGEPSQVENYQHLKEEIARQIPLQRAVDQFTALAISCKVPIYDLKIPTTFLLQEADIKDGSIGMTWIVDPLLDHQKMRKFSGSNKAGSNTDFAGQTCDAFAHFTLADSMVFVAVDIQGIDTPNVINGVKGANSITLLDSMAHSRDRTMGLGDNGMTGIQEFCKQHECNPICKRLDLPDLDTLLSDLKNSGIDELASGDDAGNASPEGSIIAPVGSEYNLLGDTDTSLNPDGACE